MTKIKLLIGQAKFVYQLEINRFFMNMLICWLT